MVVRIGVVVATLVLAGAAVVLWQMLKSGPKPISQAAFEALYTPPPDAVVPARVYHIGHSLVGRDMPAMLAALGGHGYESQLGWGAHLRQHWEPDVPVNGFEAENAHPRYRDAHEAVGSGDYAALVLTEAVEIRDTIKSHAPELYLKNWATRAWAANPETRVYFYETWHRLDGDEDWLERLDADLGRYWEGAILRRALAYEGARRPIYVIPGGQVMAAVVRTAEAGDGIGPIRTRADLFSDAIHFNDYGAYLMALTHYAVLYGRSPVGLPHDMTRADGTPAQDMGADAARRLQEIVWEVVTSLPQTGVAG